MVYVILDNNAILTIAADEADFVSEPHQIIRLICKQEGRVVARFEASKIVGYSLTEAKGRTFAPSLPQSQRASD